MTNGESIDWEAKYEQAVTEVEEFADKLIKAESRLKTAEKMAKALKPFNDKWEWANECGHKWEAFETLPIHYYNIDLAKQALKEWNDD